jgi:hypothetical protein
MITQRMLFDHQDGAMEFEVHVARYHLTDDGQLSFSIECRESADFDHLSSPFFSVFGLDIGLGPKAGDVHAFENQLDSRFPGRRPSVFVYHGAHGEPRHIRVVIEQVTAAGIRVSGSFELADDVIYYDDRARPTPVEFAADLRAAPLETLWKPVT